VICQVSQSGSKDSLSSSRSLGPTVICSILTGAQALAGTPATTPGFDLPAASPAPPSLVRGRQPRCALRSAPGLRSMARPNPGHAAPGPARPGPAPGRVYKRLRAGRAGWGIVGSSQAGLSAGASGDVPVLLLPPPPLGSVRFGSAWLGAVPAAARSVGSLPSAEPAQATRVTPPASVCRPSGR